MLFVTENVFMCVDHQLNPFTYFFSCATCILATFTAMKHHCIKLELFCTLEVSR